MARHTFARAVCVAALLLVEASGPLHDQSRNVSLARMGRRHDLPRLRHGAAMHPTHAVPMGELAPKLAAETTMAGLGESRRVAARRSAAIPAPFAARGGHRGRKTGLPEVSRRGSPCWSE